jgi:hypothetical protein
MSQKDIGRLNSTRKPIKAKDFLWIILVAVVALFVFMVFWISYFRKDPEDYGGSLSLLVTIGIAISVLCYREKYGTEVIDDIKNAKDSLWSLIFISTILGGFISFWLAIRASGYYIYTYISDEKFIFGIGNIFGILGYVLVANLCFSLYRTFKKIGLGGTDKEKGVATDALLDWAIQAVIIGLLVFLPRYSDGIFVDEIIHGYPNFVILLMSMIGILLSLTIIKYYVLTQKESSSKQ